MRIKNTTNWDTSCLRKIFSFAKKQADRIEGKQKNNFIVRVKKSNRFSYSMTRDDFEGRVWGRAVLGGWDMTIMTAIKDITPEVKKRLAEVFTHEYYHLLGYA
jgi:hypothetical protein